MTTVPRRESRIKHAYKAHLVHAHVRPSRRDPDRLVAVRCHRADCWQFAPKGRWHR